MTGIFILQMKQKGLEIAPDLLKVTRWLCGWAGSSSVQCCTHYMLYAASENLCSLSGLEGSFAWLTWRVHSRIRCALDFQHGVYIAFPCSSELKTVQPMKIVILGRECVVTEREQDSELKAPHSGPGLSLGRVSPPPTLLHSDMSNPVFSTPKCS